MREANRWESCLSEAQWSQDISISHGTRWSPIPLSKEGYLWLNPFWLDPRLGFDILHLRSLSLSKGSLIEPKAVPIHPAKLFPSKGKSVTSGNG